MKSYFVYIMTNRSRTLYIGVTSDLLRRVYEHKTKSVPGFTSRYRIDRLVYYAETRDVMAAITEEKKLKGWTRKRKIALVEAMNSTWRDLSEGWYESDGDIPAQQRSTGAVSDSTGVPSGDPSRRRP